MDNRGKEGEGTSQGIRTKDPWTRTMGWGSSLEAGLDGTGKSIGGGGGCVQH